MREYNAFVGLNTCHSCVVFSQMSIILLNLLLGPSLFRAALIRVGEAKGQGLTLPTLKDQPVADPLSEEDDPGMANTRRE